MLAAKLSGDALPRPQMQVKLAGFARAELGKQAVTLSNLVMGWMTLCSAATAACSWAPCPR